jgi:hypothetical protein
MRNRDARGLSDNRQLAGRDLGVVIFERGEQMPVGVNVRAALICHFALYGLLMGFHVLPAQNPQKP